MILVNLFGAPGSGKSTGAAHIFSQLKMAGINAELITEFAKDKVWEESKEVFNNQAYIFGKQYFRISRCQEKVDIIITDSPLLLSSFYNTNQELKNEFDALVGKVFFGYDTVNYFLERAKPYNPEGRFQTEEESNCLSKDMEIFLDMWDVTYDKISGDIQGYSQILKDLIKMLEFRKMD